MTGYVYAIRNEHDQIKIGYSIDPPARLKTLSVGVPFDVVLVGYKPGTSADEYELHRLLAPWRIRGEWYRNEGDVASFVLSLPQMNIAGIAPRQMSWDEKRGPTRPKRARGPNSKTAVAQVIKALCGQARVAELCGVSQRAVSNWAVSGKFPAYTRIILGSALASIGHEIDESLWVSERGSKFKESAAA